MKSAALWAVTVVLEPLGSVELVVRPGWVSGIVKMYSLAEAADKSVAHMWKWHWNSQKV